MTQNLKDMGLKDAEKRVLHKRPEALTAPYGGESKADSLALPGEMPADHPRVRELRAKGHTGPIYEVNVPVPPSERHPFRTKGTPFSRVRLIEVIPAKDGRPAEFVYRHLTRKTGRAVPATPDTIGHFMGGNLPFHMATELLGGL